MNDVTEFLSQIDAILKRLDLPTFFLNEGAEEDTHEFMRQRLALCFPNLTGEERLAILRLNLLAQVLPRVLAHQAFADGSTDRVELAATKKFIRTEYLALVNEVDVAGVRARLSDFQEQLLEYFSQMQS